MSTQTDDELAILKHTIIQGWPKSIKQVPPVLQLEDLVLNSELCLKYSTAKCKLEHSLTLGQEVPIYSWTKLTTDIFHFESD